MTSPPPINNDNVNTMNTPMNNLDNANNVNNDNPYAAPNTDLNINTGNATHTANFYVVSHKKFVVLMTVTLGLYSIYWFWKHWHTWKNTADPNLSTDVNIWPIPRAIFNIFFIHSLFKKFHQKAELKAGKGLPDINNAATVYVAAAILSNVSSRLLSDLPIFLDFLSVIIFLVLFYWSLWQGQQQANIACGDEQGSGNAAFTGVNYVFIVLGVIIWLLMLIGLFVG